MARSCGWSAISHQVVKGNHIHICINITKLKSGRNLSHSTFLNSARPKILFFSPRARYKSLNWCIWIRASQSNAKYINPDRYLFLKQFTAKLIHDVFLNIIVNSFEIFECISFWRDIISKYNTWPDTFRCADNLETKKLTHSLMRV